MIYLFLALIVLPSLIGALIVAAANIFSSRVLVVMTGAVLGQASFITLAYLLSAIFSLNLILLNILSTCLVILIFLINWRWRTLKKLLQGKPNNLSIIIFALSLLLFALIAPKLLILENGDLKTGIINAYGDVAWHTANITLLAESPELPPLNPILAGQQLTYPFLTNFLSSMLLVAGLSLPWTVNLPALILIPLILTLLYLLASHFGETPKTKQLAGVIAVVLFLFGGATFGWVNFGADFVASGLPLSEFIIHLPNQDYSGVGTSTQGFHFLNPVTSLLLPQRAFLFGMSIALSLLLVLIVPRQKTKAQFIIAGILAGLLPLFHAHTVIAMSGVILLLIIFNRKNWRLWRWFIVVAAALGLPEVFYYLAGGVGNSNSFFRFDPGWLAQENIIFYWFKNTGLIIPLSIIGLFLPLPKLLKILAAVGLALLLVSNIFLFAPWAWDNYKLIVWWFILSLPLIAYLLTRAWQMPKATITRPLVLSFIVLHTLSGGLDVWKLSLSTTPSWLEWDDDTAAMAQLIKKNVPKKDSLLTAPIHNNVAALAGRPTYLGYAAHVWSHGENPWTREDAIKEFYEGRLTKLPEHQPQWVVVGPYEQQKYQVVVQSNWQLKVATNSYQLYKVRQ